MFLYFLGCLIAIRFQRSMFSRNDPCLHYFAVIILSLENRSQNDNIIIYRHNFLDNLPERYRLRLTCLWENDRQRLFGYHVNEYFNFHALHANNRLAQLDGLQCLFEVHFTCVCIFLVAGMPMDILMIIKQQQTKIIAFSTRPALNPAVTSGGTSCLDVLKLAVVTLHVFSPALQRSDCVSVQI